MLNKQNYLRFWCQKVLPTVYDDSLSYYELLNKVVKHLNEHAEAINELIDFVNNFNDDIEQVLEEMLEDGKLDEPITNIIGAIVAKEYDPDSSYVLFDYCLYGGKLYRAKESTTGEFDPEKWDEKILCDDISVLENIVYGLTANNMTFNPNGTYDSGTIGAALLGVLQTYVSNVAYNSGSHAIEKTINGTTSKVIDVEDSPTDASNKLPSSKSVYSVNNKIQYNGNEYAGKRLLMIGDSWLAGYTGEEGSSDINKGWTKSCSDMLKCGMYRIRQPGGGFCQAGSNISAYPNKTYGEALELFRAEYPNIDFYAVVVQGGVNDLIHSWTGANFQTAFVAFKALIDEYYPNAKLFLIPTWANTLMPPSILSLAKLYVQYAMNSGFNTCAESFNWFIDCWAASLFGNDQYHLSYSGYDYCGKWIAQYMLTGESKHVSFGWTTSSGTNPMETIVFDPDNTDAANSSYVINGTRNLISFFSRIKINSTATSSYVRLMSGIPNTIINGVYLHVRNNDGSNDPVPRMYLVGNELRMYPDGVDRSGKTFTADIMYFSAQNIR